MPDHLGLRGVLALSGAVTAQPSEAQPLAERQVYLAVSQHIVGSGHFALILPTDP